MSDWPTVTVKERRKDTWGEWSPVVGSDFRPFADDETYGIETETLEPGEYLLIPRDRVRVEERMTLTSNRGDSYKGVLLVVEVDDELL